MNSATPPPPDVNDPTFAQLRAALDQITPEQINEWKAGRLVLPTVLASMMVHRLGLDAIPVPESARGASGFTDGAEARAWLASQDTYEAARARAESAGASPANLNALLQPDSLTLPCGLRMLPMTISGYVFLEAVQSPYLGGGTPGPEDTLLLACALIEPEACAALMEFDDDFNLTITDKVAFKALATRIGNRAGAEDVPRLLAHATKQFALMFPKAPAESESGDPLGAKPAATAS